MSEIRKRLRAYRDRSEEVGALRGSRGVGKQRKLDTAITCRNDALLGIELEFSALRNQNKELQALVEKLDKEASDA